MDSFGIRTPRAKRPAEIKTEYATLDEMKNWSLPIASACCSSRSNAIGNGVGSGITRGRSDRCTRSTRSNKSGSSSSSSSNTRGMNDPAASAAVQQQQQQKKFVCSLPDCTHLAFARPADLARHNKHVHRPLEKKESFVCDYPDCARHKNPHYRKDHFRDHLRDVHMEDLIKHGSNAHGPSPTSSMILSPVTAVAATSTTMTAASPSIKQQMEWLWLSSLPTDPSWWRCSKCLHRVQVADKGFSCCNTCIEPIRLKVRQARNGTLESCPVPVTNTK